MRGAVRAIALPSIRFDPMQTFDISRSLRSDLAPWPGDVAFNYKLTGRIPDGSTVNVVSNEVTFWNFDCPLVLNRVREVAQ